MVIEDTVEIYGPIPDNVQDAFKELTLGVDFFGSFGRETTDTLLKVVILEHGLTPDQVNLLLTPMVCRWCDIREATIKAEEQKALKNPWIRLGKTVSDIGEWWGNFRRK